MRLERHFPMSLDRFHRALTGVVFAISAGVLAIQFALCGPPVRWIPWLTFAALAVIMVPTWALAPAGIAVDEATLQIRRRGWRPVTIALSDITAIESNPERTIGTAIRVWGVGGFFGTFGLFWSRRIGRFQAYLTRRGAGLFLRRHSGLPVLVTLDEPAALASCLRQAGVPDSE